MRIVLDTNVLVSGLLKPYGTCGEIVRLLTSGEIVLCLDARILIEYEDVFRRPAFGIDPAKIDIVMEYFANAAEKCAGTPLSADLPDPDDNAFLEVAFAARADYLVTGNLKHFPARCRAGVRVLSPAAFIDVVRKRRR
ncbi:MAG: putative toxin-antitoxin system toxin component, PIN family [bacterium]|nr:putative toxin-antitoxin system toxin component, PIN family [bacterium]